MTKIAHNNPGNMKVRTDAISGTFILRSRVLRHGALALLSNLRERQLHSVMGTFVMRSPLATNGPLDSLSKFFQTEPTSNAAQVLDHVNIARRQKAGKKTSRMPDCRSHLNSSRF